MNEDSKQECTCLTEEEVRRIANDVYNRRQLAAAMARLEVTLSEGLASIETKLDLWAERNKKR
jgi:hypothetical protein